MTEKSAQGEYSGQVVVIFNPASRAALAGAVTAASLEAELQARGLVGQVVTAASEHAAAALADQAARAGAVIVVAAGGDGTVHAVASGLLRAARMHASQAGAVEESITTLQEGEEDNDVFPQRNAEKRNNSLRPAASSAVNILEGPALGIIPLGTINNIAGALGIPEDAHAALDVIAGGLRPGGTRPLDVGIMDDRPFVEVAGAGMLASLIPAGESVKGRPWAFLQAAHEIIHIVRRSRATRVSLRLDDRAIQTRATEITICNTPRYGIQFAEAPDARVDDGLLDVVVYERFSGPELLRHVIAIIGGRRVPDPRVRRFHAQSLAIQPARAWPMQVDGEEVGRCGPGTSLPAAQVHIWPAALRVCAPLIAAARAVAPAEGAAALLRALPAPPATLAHAIGEVTDVARQVMGKVADAAAVSGAPPDDAAPPPLVADAIEPPHRAARRVTALRALYLTGFIIGVGASLAARRTGILPGDLPLTQAIQRRRTPALDRFMTAVAAPGFLPLSAETVIGAAAAFWFVRLRLEAAFMLLASGADGLNWILKRIVRRRRPTDELVRVTRIIREPSFPSGHVMHYVSTFGFLAAAAIANLRPSKLRAALVAACLSMIGLVGPCRVYLGAHWPSDVGAGYIFGGLWLGGLLDLYTRAKRYQAGRTTS
jgi:diacylglycerol kinase family enzyme/membrane-associated phospholipid phosphatase